MYRWRLATALALAACRTPLAGALPAHAPGEAVVGFRSGATALERSIALAAVAAHDAIALGKDGPFLVRVADTEDAIARLAQLPAVVSAEPNLVFEIEGQRAGVLFSAVPNDPLFAQQWALDNRGQTGGTPGADLDAVRAWDLTTGGDVIVALLDTGIDLAHADLAANLWTNPGEIAGNGQDDDGNGFADDVHGWDFANGDADPSDDNGQGTMLAGILGAAGDDAAGMTGVAQHVRIAAVKCMSAQGNGTLAQIIAAILYATSIGARVLVIGWGGGTYSQALHDAIATAADAGIPFVAPAGRSSVDLDANPIYPGSYALANVVTVTASDDDDLLAPFSNYGPATVDLAAPGIGIVATVRGGGHTPISGTGSAAAHAAGAFALLFARFPATDGTAAIEHLASRADSIPALAGKVSGARRLNAYLPLLETPSDAPGATGANDLHAWWIRSHEGGAPRLGFDLAHPGAVRVDVFDARGRRVAGQHLGELAGGRHAWSWDGRDAAGRRAARGTYVVRLRTPSEAAAVQVVLERGTPALACGRSAV